MAPLNNHTTLGARKHVSVHCVTSHNERSRFANAVAERRLDATKRIHRPTTHAPAGYINHTGKTNNATALPKSIYIPAGAPKFSGRAKKTNMTYCEMQPSQSAALATANDAAARERSTQATQNYAAPS